MWWSLKLGFDKKTKLSYNKLMLEVKVYNSAVDLAKERIFRLLGHKTDLSKSKVLLPPTLGHHELITNNSRNGWLGILALSVRSVDLSTDGSPAGFVKIGGSSNGDEKAYKSVFPGDKVTYMDGDGKVVEIVGV